jgi:preprotein translocase subunit SecB
VSDAPSIPSGTEAARAPVQAQFAIKKIYLKDLSFEAPHSPAAFIEQAPAKPSVDLHFQNKAAPLGDDNYEVVLIVTASLKVADRTLYLVEVQQAGVFGITGIGQEQVGAVLATACPNVLLPFAREVICDVVAKGGFPQLLIAPVNFELLYLQEMQRRQQQAEGKQARPH